MGLAGAIVYISCKKYDEKINQFQIANATGITLTTLRRDLRFLENIIK
jgi:transcription initiation factor TFIIIB Brf1 subunit/transcription initiation factor TFIIB